MTGFAVSKKPLCEPTFITKHAPYYDMRQRLRGRDLRGIKVCKSNLVCIENCYQHNQAMHPGLFIFVAIFFSLVL